MLIKAISVCFGRNYPLGMVFAFIMSQATSWAASEMSPFLEELSEAVLQRGSMLDTRQLNRETERDFPLNAELLSQGHMQASAQLMGKTAFLASRDKDLDIDGLQQRLKKNDLVLVGKTAMILQGVVPEQMNHEQFSQEDFARINANLQAGDSLQIEDGTDGEKVLHSIVKILRGLIEIDSRIHSQSFDQISQIAHGIHDVSSSRLLSSFPRELGEPQMVYSPYFSHKDVNIGTHGGRTYNYYYRIPGCHCTLHVSERIITLKYDYLTMMNWTAIQHNAIQSVTKDAFTSHINIEAYLSARLDSPSTHQSAEAEHQEEMDPQLQNPREEEA